MKRSNVLLVVSLAMFSLLTRAQSHPAVAQSTTKEAAGTAVLPAATVAMIQKRVESFLRNMFAWGPDFALKMGALKAGPIDGLYEQPVTVSNQGQSDTAVVFVSKNGRYMFRGEVQDLDSDPLAETRKEIDLNGYASKGPANAKVQVVEFADFECPSCRQLEYVLRMVLPNYPQVRFVFKDFPLDQIHPWASRAAIAGHCALNQSADIFWKFHGAVYDDQDLISVDNANSKLADIATMAGADPAAFQECMNDPKTAAMVEESTKEGQKLGLTGTPTTFVDGRRMVGPDQALLEQYIKYELGTNP